MDCYASCELYGADTYSSVSASVCSRAPGSPSPGIRNRSLHVSYLIDNGFEIGPKNKVNPQLTTNPDARGDFSSAVLPFIWPPSGITTRLWNCCFPERPISTCQIRTAALH